MPTCAECDSDANQVWRHRVFESETQRRIRWVCRSCHPELSVDLAIEPVTEDEPSATDPSETGSERSELRSDGGRRGGVAAVSAATGPAPDSRCPVCLAVNGQGLYECPDCDWTGTARYGRM